MGQARWRDPSRLSEKKSGINQARRRVPILACFRTPASQGNIKIGSKRGCGVLALSWERRTGGRPLPFSAVEVPAPLPVPGATVMMEAWVYAP